MNNSLRILTAVLALSVGSTAYSQTIKYFPGATVDQRTLMAQRRVDDIYDKGDYDRALLIYEKELAPIGDKYAQYMVGYMHLAGKSVPVSQPDALAWYRLAAERGDPMLVRARDNLHQAMSAEEVEESNRIFAKLWREIGDNRLLLDLIREDLDVLKERTGSRIPGAYSGRLTIINVQNGRGSDEYYENLRKRVDKRLEYLDSNVEIHDVDIEEENDADSELIRSLETEIREELAALDSP